MHRMESDIVHSVDKRLVFRGRCLIATVALEGEVRPADNVDVNSQNRGNGVVRTMSLFHPHI